jgi:hypothetical protein
MFRPVEYLLNAEYPIASGGLTTHLRSIHKVKTFKNEQSKPKGGKKSQADIAAVPRKSLHYSSAISLPVSDSSAFYERTMAKHRAETATEQARKLCFRCRLSYSLLTAQKRSTPITLPSPTPIKDRRPLS